MSLRRGLVLLTDHAARRPWLLTRSNFRSTLHDNSFGPSTPRARSLSQNPALELPVHRLELLKAVKRKDIEDIRLRYGHLRRVVQALPVIQGSRAHYRTMDEKDVRKILEVLSASPDPQDAFLVVRVLQDCKDMGILVSHPTTSLVMTALVNAWQPGKVFDLIYCQLRKYGRFNPTSEQWIALMQHYEKDAGPQVMLNCVEAMKKIGPSPTNAVYSLLLAKMIKSRNTVGPEDYVKVFDAMKWLGLPFDADILKLLEKARAFLLDNVCDNVVEAYKERLMQPVTAEQTREWITTLQAAMNRGGRMLALRKLDGMKVQGFVPDERTLANMMVNVTSVEEMRHLEKGVGVMANDVVWGVLIRNAFSARGVAIALDLYEQAKSCGIRPNSTMVHPLLMGLCGASIGTPDPQKVDRALSLYRELMAKVYDPVTGELLPAESRIGGPDTPVYNTILRALASTGTQYHAVANELLNDMFQLNLPMDSMTAASIAVLLIRSSSSYEEAFNTYLRVRKLRRNIFDGQGYTAILHAYCSLQFGPHSFPPAHGYFEIVRAMEREGHPMTCAVYTILLKRYATLATRVYNMEPAAERHALQAALEAAIRRTHNMLTLDASITPDVILWSQLMDAYNRIGAFQSCLQIWNTLWVTNTFDNTAVSIIIDACGFAGSYVRGSAIFSGVQEAGFTLNRHNWNTWVECLCRLDRLDMAMKVVCLEMPEQPLDTRPDISTVEIILKFAIQQNQEAHVRSRVKRYLPDVWQALPPEQRYHA